MRPALLILGAAEEQLPLYREARRRGLGTIAVDRSADRPALRPDLGLVDEFLNVSTDDAAAIVAALGGRRPAAVVSCASDACLSAWHELSERFALPYRYPRAAAITSLDKALFHDLAASVGAAGPRWTVARDPDVLMAGAASFGPPMVVKPDDGNGSRGITLVRAPGELPAAFEHAKAHARSGRVLAEEYVEGRQLVVELFLRAGTPRLAAVLEKRFAPGPGFVASGLVCPARVAGTAALIRAAVRITEAMGVTDGPANFDVVAAPDGRFVFVEGSGRAGGNGIPLLLRAHSGVDTAAALVSVALGEEADLRAGTPRAAELRLLASPLGEPGELAAVSGLDEARNVPGIAAMEFYPRSGDAVLPYTEAGRKIGHVVATGATAMAASGALDRALAALEIVIVPTPAPAPAPAPAPEPQGESDALH
jgi:biotin carboxylase